MNTQLIDQFLVVWSKLDARSIDAVDGIYAADVQFVDPFVRLDGIERLKRYLHHSYDGVSQVAFSFESPLIVAGEAVVRWRLRFRHPRLNGGDAIEVPGISHLRFDERVTHHTDYYDAGALLYEQVPLLGSVVRSLKKRLQG